MKCLDPKCGKEIVTVEMWEDRIIRTCVNKHRTGKLEEKDLKPLIETNMSNLKVA